MQEFARHMNYRLVIFDFDGTLADSFPFFLRVFNELADRHGFRRIDPAHVPAYRNLSPRQMMAEVGLPAWKLPLVARDFIALMRTATGGIKLFPHVGTLLRWLRKHDVVLAIVSSNAEDNVRAVLGPRNAALIDHFECGMSMFGKAPRIRRVIKNSGIAARESLYVGDQSSDCDAARSVGIAFGAVAWGYSTAESLRALKPDEMFDAVTDIKRVVSTR